MKLITRSFAFLAILLFGTVIGAHAQSASVEFGLGTATDSSSNQCISNFGETSGGCFNPNVGAFGFTSPKMTGLFGIFGAEFMIKHHLGVGGEYSFRMHQGDYGDVLYRPGFYDFNAIYEPIAEPGKIIPQLQAGLGGAETKFYEPSSCDQLTCSGSTFVESANHFQLHFAAGVKIYVKGALFVRPQVDLHWVNNFAQFGSGLVPQYTVAIGYTIGGR